MTFRGFLFFLAATQVEVGCIFAFSFFSFLFFRRCFSRSSGDSDEDEEGDEEGDPIGLNKVTSLNNSLSDMILQMRARQNKGTDGLMMISSLNSMSPFKYHVAFSHVMRRVLCVMCESKYLVY